VGLNEEKSLAFPPLVRGCAHPAQRCWPIESGIWREVIEPSALAVKDLCALDLQCWGLPARSSSFTNSRLTPPLRRPTSVAARGDHPNERSSLLISDRALRTATLGPTMQPESARQSLRANAEESPGSKGEAPGNAWGA
jgi:hypothetical protein